jgi:hypothetical protein
LCAVISKSLKLPLSAAVERKGRGGSTSAAAGMLVPLYLILGKGLAVRLDLSLEFSFGEGSGSGRASDMSVSVLENQQRWPRCSERILWRLISGALVGRQANVCVTSQERDGIYAGTIH